MTNELKQQLIELRDWAINNGVSQYTDIASKSIELGIPKLSNKSIWQLVNLAKSAQETTEVDFDTL